jgi:hypothetical protein
LLLVPPAIADTANVFVTPTAATAAAATIIVIIVIIVVVIVIVAVVLVVVVIVIVLVIVVIVIAIPVAAVVFAAAAASVVAIIPTAIAVAIATTTTTHLCCSHCWLVVALLSAVCFCHRTPSCNHQRSRCRPLLPPIVVCCRHRRHCHCQRAATASTATTMVKLTVVHCQRKATAEAPPAY